MSLIIREMQKATMRHHFTLNRKAVIKTTTENKQELKGFHWGISILV
jgi:hypothetical protein